MAYQFKIFKDVPVPERVFERARVYDFPWDDIEPGASFAVPRDYWLRPEIGLTDKHIDRPKDGKQESGARDLRDRIKRSFATWQKSKDPANKLQVVLRDDRDAKTGKYLGVHVWVQHRDQSEHASRTIASRGSKQSKNK